MNRLCRQLLCILCAALAAHAGAALAQKYPSKAIHIVVPFVAGGAADSFARLMGPKMSEALGQPVVVDNRPGAGGNIGLDVVAKAAPDGYTILITPNSIAIGPALYRKLPFDTARDFVPVTQLINTELVLVASPKLLASSVSELIALAKSRPGALNYGSTGIGNPLALTVELLKTSAGIDILAIPYKGDGQLTTALMAGDVDLAVVPLASGLQHIRSGAVRALGVASSRRSPSLPDVPTIAESGVPGFESTSWQGLFAPARTSGDIVETIQRAAVKALAAPVIRDRLPSLGQQAIGSTPQEFDAKFRADMAKFAKIIKDARIPMQD